MTKKTVIFILIPVLLIAAVLAYLYFFLNGPGSTVTPIVTGNNPSDPSFTPFGQPPAATPDAGTGMPTNVPSPTPFIDEGTPIPSLRLLSNTPVGGYSASTTSITIIDPNATTTAAKKIAKTKTIYKTAVRWVDRGRGNIYESLSDTLEIKTLSNTVLPRVYESIWNKNINSFIGTMAENDGSSPSTIYARLQATMPATNRTSSSTVSDSGLATTPYELKGRTLPENIITYAVSPKGDKIFLLIKEVTGSAGYIANFDGTAMTRILEIPLTQVTAEWPEENTIAISTKGSASHDGFLYFANPKTGVLRKILGPMSGLSAKVSKDAKFVVYSSSGSIGRISTNIMTVASGTSTDALTRTIADKCVWGNFYKELVYCAAPSEIVSATYPDDWYRGNVSFTDKIWQMNALTGEINLVTIIVDQSDRLIDAYNLALDPRDDFLFFMNKKDLSLWSFDLSISR